MMSNNRSNAADADLVTLGKITTVYGIKGWVKIHSFTEPYDNLFEYLPWVLQVAGATESVDIDQVKWSGDTLVAHIVGCDDRDYARRYSGCLIQVAREQLPELEEGEYYWNDLLGLSVLSVSGDDFGAVTDFIETGSNDVLVVKRTSADQYGIKERLIPYLPEQVIQKVDLDAGQIVVDWEPEF